MERDFAEKHMHSHNDRCREIPWVQDQSWRPELKPKPRLAPIPPKPKGIVETLDERFGCLLWFAILFVAALAWMAFLNWSGISGATRCIFPQGPHGGWTC